MRGETIQGHDWNHSTDDDMPCRRQMIKDIALKLFLRDGYGNVSLRQLALPLGMQAGSLYSHFQSKQALLFELLREHQEDWLDQAEWVVGQERIPAKKLSAFVRQHVEFQLEYGELAQLSCLEARNLTDDQRSTLKGLQRKYLEVLMVVARSQRLGQVEGAELRAAVCGVMGMLTSITFWYRRSGSITPDALIDKYTAMIALALNH